MAYILDMWPLEGPSMRPLTWMSTWAIVLDTFSQWQICLKRCSLTWNISRHHRLSNEYLCIIVIARVLVMWRVKGQSMWSLTWMSTLAIVLDTFSQWQICLKRCCLAWNISRHHKLSNDNLFYHCHRPCSRYVTLWRSKYVVTYMNVYMSNCLRHLFSVTNIFETMLFSLKHIWTS